MNGWRDALLNDFLALHCSGMPSQLYWQRVQTYPDPAFWLRRSSAFYRQFALADSVISSLQVVDSRAVDQLCAWAQQRDCHIILPVDKNYPRCLFAAAKPPLLLFVRGHCALLSQPQLAVVGARNATWYGLETATTWSEQLAADCLLTSGMAFGVDAAAHWAALRAGHASIAVLGLGVDKIYPRAHTELYHALAAQGAIVSEYCWMRGYHRGVFAQRNRIISALADAVLVVEAGERSGALITARCAFELAKPVFAVPGRVTQPHSLGCHRLIQQGAHCVVSPQDVRSMLAMRSRG